MLRKPGLVPVGALMDKETRDVSSTAVLAQLERICTSPAFDASQRNRRFLEYVVRESLAGRSDRIKGYCIATVVFGRDESFDPLIDPIVRIEASRLRRSLERYYLTAGATDPIRIDIPKGSYIATFTTLMPAPDVSENDLPAATAAGTRLAPSRGRHRGTRLAALTVLVLSGLAVAWFAIEHYRGFSLARPGDALGPSVYVERFDQESDDPDMPEFAVGLKRDIVSALTAFNGLHVMAATLPHDPSGDATRLDQAWRAAADYTLQGGVSIEKDRFRVTTLLVDARTGRHVWSGNFEDDVTHGPMHGKREAIAHDIAQAVALPYGAIYANEIGPILGARFTALTPYQCVTRFYHYWRSYQRDEYQTVRDCLEVAVVEHPDYAEATAALSLALIDAFRVGFGDDRATSDPLLRARQLAQHAVDIAPRNARGYHALALAYWLSGEVERSLDAAETGLEMSPGDTELMADLGYRYCARNQCEKGVELVREAFARNPSQPSVYRLAFFLDHFINGRFDAALTEARIINMPDVIYGDVIIAMAEARLGNTAAARAVVDRILARKPDFADMVAADLGTRNVHPDLVTMIVLALQEAGLPATALDARH